MKHKNLSDPSIHRLHQTEKFFASNGLITQSHYMHSGKRKKKEAEREKKIFIFPILTNTLNAISNPTFSATAFETSLHVDTQGMHITVVSSHFTLIHIYKHKTNYQYFHQDIKNYFPFTYFHYEGLHPYKTIV